MEFVHSLEPEVVVGLVDEELGSKPPLSEAEKKNATILISLETFEISLLQIVPLPKNTDRFLVNLLAHFVHIQLRELTN